MILGAALGAFIIGNPPTVKKRAKKTVGLVKKGSPYDKKVYLEMLSLMFQMFKLAKTKGALALEEHVEKPQDSKIFNAFPTFAHNHHALIFVCDYMRMWTLGNDNANETETLMEQEIDLHHHEEAELSHAIQTMADGMPALGIVAAVLGVIKTMASIDQPPEVLGKLIGGALVGTFLGVFFAYGFVGPAASALKFIADEEHKFYTAIKVAMLAHMNGYAPAISIEFARKTVPNHVRPTFYELEQAVSDLPKPE